MLCEIAVWNPSEHAEIDDPVAAPVCRRRQMILNRAKAMKYRAISYMVANLGSKASAAIAQLYAIFVFTKMHTQDEADLPPFAIPLISWKSGICDAMAHLF